MFADSAKIVIKSGRGGDGHVSFRRELFVAAGGPDGGDGGRGGDVIFQVDKGMNTLGDFRHMRKYAAGNGKPGEKKKRHGADGEDMIIKVPEGTVVKDAESGQVIVDMSGDNQRVVVLHGGRGGHSGIRRGARRLSGGDGHPQAGGDPLGAQLSGGGGISADRS